MCMHCAKCYTAGNVGHHSSCRYVCPSGVASQPCHAVHECCCAEWFCFTQRRTDRCPVRRITQKIITREGRLDRSVKTRVHAWSGRPEGLLGGVERVPKQGGLWRECLRLGRVKVGPGVVCRSIWQPPSKTHIPPLTFGLSELSLLDEQQAL